MLGVAKREGAVEGFGVAGPKGAGSLNLYGRGFYLVNVKVQYRLEQETPIVFNGPLLKGPKRNCPLWRTLSAVDLDVE